MGGWIGGFVNPALALGALAVALPLLIHLLNRQRHKPMPWAAMRFVLAAWRKTRRRVELENLLLLLLRMGAVGLLAFALARPFTGKDSPLGSLTERRRDLVLVLDASASMGARQGVQSVFEAARERARELGRGLDGAHGDRLRLILAGGHPRLVSWTTPEQGLSVLDTLDVPCDEPLDLAGALGEVDKLAREAQAGGAEAALEVHLLTDLQRRAFLPHEGAEEDQRSRALIEVLDSLQQLSLRVVVEDLSGAERVPPNLGIESVRALGEIYAAGMPAEIAVGLVNHGAQARAGVRVSLSVDGERRPSQVLDLGPRASAEAVFQVTFASSGEHLVQASIEGDRLAADNERAQVFSVPDSLRVLLVDGQPSAAIDEDEVGYLRMVLEPPGDDAAPSGSGAAPFLPRVARPEELPALELSAASLDAIWLANVDRLSQPVADRLERFVAHGGLLVISAGDALDTAAWNQRLFRADGTGLLPCEFGRRLELPSRKDAHWRVAAFDLEHPALSFFADERFKLLLTEAPVYALLATQPLARARVLASLDDPARSALLLERSYDRGRVLVWTTSIDMAWTRIPESPATLVPLVHELLRYGARAQTPRRNLSPGEGLEVEVPGEVFPRNPALVKPDGSRRPLEGEALPLEGGRWKLPAIPGKETEHIGAYRIEREGAPPVPFSVQLDAREGDLERLSPEELALHPVLVALGSREREQDSAALPERGELWRWLALACLGFLVLESLWAAWIGRRRKVA